jgi:hypothetical protein
VSDPAKFDAHCMALGKLCVAWAIVDRQLNDLLGALLGSSPTATACLASTVDAVGARCDIMRRLIHEDPLTEEWVTLCTKMLVTVSDDLAARRNRYVHDYWSLTEGTLVRLDRRVIAKRPQSRQPVKLSFDSEHATPPDAIERLTEEIGQMVFLLHVAARDVRDWKKHRFRPTPPLLCRAYALPDLPDMLKTVFWADR